MTQGTDIKGAFEVSGSNSCKGQGLGEVFKGGRHGRQSQDSDIVSVAKQLKV